MALQDAELDDLGIVTGEAVALEVRATSWVLRAAGAIIDVLIELGAALALFSAVAIIGSALLAQPSVAAAIVIIDIVVCFVIAPMIVETATRGRSVGKLVVGARIVREDGGAIALRHAFIRALVGLIEIVATFGGGAALTGLLNRRAQRLGDLLAGTVSQYERVPVPPSNAVGVPQELAEWATIADVGRLPDRLARRIAAFLSTASQLSPDSRARLARDLAAEASPYVAPAVDASPELLLAAVAAIRRDREFAALMLERDRFQDLQQVLTAAPHGFPDR